MGAWKSEDGGSLRRYGSSYYSAAGVGTVTIVPAGTNVRGVIVHSVSMISPEDATAADFLSIGGNIVMANRGGTTNKMTEMFVPAATEVGETRNSASNIYVSYTIL